MIKAVFVGTNSMGYKHGEQYTLKTYIENGFLWIAEVDGKAKDCPYKNLETFMDNWVILMKTDIAEDGNWSDF